MFFARYTGYEIKKNAENEIHKIKIINFYILLFNQIALIYYKFIEKKFGLNFTIKSKPIINIDNLFFVFIYY